jgi:SAM-dependent methyltransferase
VYTIGWRPGTGIVRGILAPMDNVEAWRRFDAMEARLTAATSERMLELAAVCEGQRVLDVATGRGEPAIRAAKRVGPRGSVLGIDVDASMLAMAQARAQADGVTNLELRVADAASPGDAVPTAAFDVALLRWGLMFMPSPVAALTTIRSALRGDGVLVLAVWAEPERVPYQSLPRRVLSQFCDVAPFERGVPGTFCYADPDRLRADVEAAGLHVVHVEDRETAVAEVDTEDELVAWVMTFGGVGAAVRGLSATDRRAFEAALVRGVRDQGPDGALRLGGVTRILVAAPSRGAAAIRDTPAHPSSPTQPTSTRWRWSECPTLGSRC